LNILGPIKIRRTSCSIYFEEHNFKKQKNNLKINIFDLNLTFFGLFIKLGIH